jgi:hypothetical protein
MALNFHQLTLVYEQVVPDGTHEITDLDDLRSSLIKTIKMHSIRKAAIC